MKRSARWGAFAMLALLFGCTALSLREGRRSGFDEMSPALQAMQRDDFSNPAMLTVQAGEQAWQRSVAGERSCASCHAGAQSMRGVATRYPAWDAMLARPVNLGTRINLCRERHQGLAPWPAESEERVALEAYVGLQSRGLPIQPPGDERLRPFVQRGEALYRQQLGQLSISCAQCHDERAGGRLGATRIPQGHATGYPIYRLEWQGMGTLARRIRNCMAGVRAEPFAPDSVEMTELELVLAARATGMPLETPAVRP